MIYEDGPDGHDDGFILNASECFMITINDDENISEERDPRLAHQESVGWSKDLGDLAHLRVGREELRSRASTSFLPLKLLNRSQR